MAYGDPYATAAEYRGRIESTVTAEDVEILATLTAVSRFIDVRCRRSRDGFNASLSEERLYRGNGLSKMWLPDDVIVITGFNIDDDGDGTADVAVVEDTDFWLGPPNADKAQEPEPFSYIEVHPNSSILSTWPTGPRTIAITAQFGYSAVPEMIRENTVAITRHLRDLQESGFALTVTNIDAAIRQSPEAAVILEMVIARYSRGAHFGSKS